MNRKSLALMLLVALILSSVASSVTAQNAAPLRITFVLNGVLGDVSFFDSAQRGLDQLVADGYNVEINTIELGIEPTGWETGLSDAMTASDSYDVLIVGTSDMGTYLAPRAHLYPDKYFIFFDDSVAYDDPAMCVEGCPNVYSVKYLQNEGSFLAGVYAAAISTSGMDGTNSQPVIGAVGGQDVPVINDFIVGYKQGACLVDPNAQVIAQYAGGWNDPAKGKEIALALYEQEADIIFQIAGQTGVGVIEAAQEQNHFVIGVDSDQGALIAETDPEQAQHVLTSMMKNVDRSLYRAVDLHIKGELPYGELEYLGVPDGVGIAFNDIYFDNTPDNILDLIDAVEEALLNDELEIVSVYPELSDPPATIDTPCDQMPELDFDVSMYLE